MSLLRELLERLEEDGADQPEREEGQILVLLALAMLGLLIAAGLATDAGMLFVRRNQLDRAVDAAALAGVTQLDSSTDPDQALRSANTRGQQLLAANDIITEEAAECDETDPDFWKTYDYCGRQSSGQLPGSIRYHVGARLDVETFFIRLLPGFETITIRSEATAEYLPMIDMFASESNFNIMQSSNEAVFGPDSCSEYGDAYSPRHSPWWDELEGAYTYRIRVPASYLAQHSSLRVEIFDPDTRNQGTNAYTIYNQAGGTLSRSCPSNSRQSPCLIPYDQDLDGSNDFWFGRTDENRTGNSGTNTGCATPGQYTPSANTRTLYRLYYLEQLADGNLQQVDLAYYVGKSDDPYQPLLASSPYSAQQAADEAQATDMHWVSPGAPDAERMPAFQHRHIFGGTNTTLLAGAEPATQVEICETFRQSYPEWTNAVRCQGDGNFIVDFNSETPGIFVDIGSSDARDIFLEVRTLSGASENGFEIWAGPPRSAGANYVVPSNINYRHIYLLRQRDPNIGNNPNIYSSHGVGVYGIGHLPMNSNINTRSDIPLTYLGAEFAGQTLRVELFDPDAEADPPVSFFFDSIPQSMWTACFDTNTGGSNCGDVGGSAEHYVGDVQLPNNNQWSVYEFTIPTESPDDLDSVPFYGGRLMVSYVGGQDDTFGWKITIEGRPFLVK